MQPILGQHYVILRKRFVGTKLREGLGHVWLVLIYDLDTKSRTAEWTYLSATLIDDLLRLEAPLLKVLLNIRHLSLVLGTENDLGVVTTVIPTTDDRLI